MLRIVQYLMRSATRPSEFKMRGATHQPNLKCVVKAGFEFKMGTTPAKKNPAHSHPSLLSLGSLLFPPSSTISFPYPEKRVWV